MADAEQPDKTELQQEAIDRRKQAREWKSVRLQDFRECYLFTAPGRMSELSPQSRPGARNTLNEPELNTDEGMLLVGDFVTQVVNTYLPEAQDWCERRAGMDVPDELFDQVKDDVKKADKKIFAAIKSSNFYAEVAKAFNPDLAIAGAGLWIDRPKAHQPIQVLAVPLREVEINLGPDGEVDDRFIIRWARNSYVRKLLGEEVWKKVEQKLKDEIEKDAKSRTEISWGWWRLWERDDDEVWQHTIMIGEKLIHHVEIKGEGCCPFLFMRFGATADWPWATGPMIQGLPTLRQVDELEMQKVMAVERAVNPAIKYPDDGVANIEQGFEAGMGYPCAQGRGQDFGAIYEQPSIEPALLEMDAKNHRLRKLFYVDHPEQTGDTPPTLGQWLDELARSQRRIGTPGYSFWREGPMRIFLRFKYLLEAGGSLPPLTSNGRLISTQPYNPAQRAAEQQEIATAVQCAQIIAQTWPEEFKLWIDGKVSMQKFIDKMRTSDLLAMRAKKDVEAALGQIKQLIGASAGGQGGPAPAAAGAPGPI